MAWNFEIVSNTLGAIPQQLFVTFVTRTLHHATFEATVPKAVRTRQPVSSLKISAHRKKIEGDTRWPQSKCHSTSRATGTDIYRILKYSKEGRCYIWNCGTEKIVLIGPVKCLARAKLIEFLPFSWQRTKSEWFRRSRLLLIWPDDRNIIFSKR